MKVFTVFRPIIGLFRRKSYQRLLFITKQSIYITQEGTGPFVIIKQSIYIAQEGTGSFVTIKQSIYITQEGTGSFVIIKQSIYITQEGTGSFFSQALDNNAYIDAYADFSVSVHSNFIGQKIQAQHSYHDQKICNTVGQTTGHGG